MKYYYDKANHPGEPDNESIWMIRIVGFSFIVVGLIELVQFNNESRLLTTILYIVLVCAGVFQLIYPKKILRSRHKKGVNYVKLEGNILQWRLGKSKNTINLDEVENIEKNVGEIVFIMENQKRSIFPTYAIENLGKFEEIREILMDLKGPQPHS